MKVLELFKGSGSITKYYQNNDDVEVISLDFEKKYNPTICIDIMEFDYKQYEPEEFEIIWASPECKVFSQLQNTWIGRKWKDKEHLHSVREEHSKFINKTIEIIDYLKPKYYFIENPRHSKIWNFIDNKNYTDKFIIVDYCYFGYGYKKPTKILTNKELDNKCCSCKKHNMRLGINSKKIISGLKEGMIPDNTTLLERYSIPPKLLDYLLM